MNFERKIIIAIDGYSSCGKSTFAKNIAHMMNYKYIDSGAMYRAFTLLCIRNHAIHKEKCNPEIVMSLLKSFQLDFSYNAIQQSFDTYMNGENIEAEIRDVEVAEKVSYISKIPQVRKRMVNIQRSLGHEKGIVMDGRDIGTVVFPDADLKIFMTASIKVRAERRYRELIEKGLNVQLEEIEKNIRKRDSLDETRNISPLKKADDAIILDNSTMTPEDQMLWFKEIFYEKFFQK